jgi:CheY-like chemotaxis protein
MNDQQDQLRPVATLPAGARLPGQAPDTAAAADASRVQRAMLATIRHDLRTPINAILGYSEMLLEDEDARDPAEGSLALDLRRIQEAGTQLLALVNEVLDPTKLDELVDLDIESFAVTLRHDLRTPIDSIIGYSELLLEDAGAADRGDAIPDLEKINQAAARFLALVDDVVNYTTAALDSGTGTPIPDPELHTADAAVLVQDVITTIRSLDQHDRSGRVECGTILIVDDNDINRDVLGRQLERQGHTVTAVCDGRAALEAVRTRAFDLILLDIIMPELNGYEVLQHLKEDETTHDLPVIMISALDELDTVVRCIELGAEDYLTKPFNSTLLRARTSACLEKKRLRDQEKEYLRHVEEITRAAAAVENSEFDPQSLAQAALRDDALGQLARVFQRMATEVYSREQRLKQEVQQLRIEIDQVKMAEQVAQITDSDFFVDLQRKASRLRPDRASNR